MNISKCIAFATLLTVSAWAASAVAQHSGDVWIGVSGDDRLEISPGGFVPHENYYTLSPITGLFSGWGDDDPGFDHITADDPDNDIFTLESGCELYLEVVETDPAFRLIYLDGFQFYFLDSPGEDLYLGDHTLHAQHDWHINSEDPDFDPQECVWQATFVLRDDGLTGYSTSQPFTFNFTNVELNYTPGDYDGDEEVDAQDYAAFADCLAGPDTQPQPDEDTCAARLQCRVSFDFNRDGDVDLEDFGELQRVEDARVGANGRMSGG